MQLVKYNINLHKIKAIFVSHLHGDHVYGLPGLLSSLSMLDRSKKLEMFVPPLLEEWLVSSLKYFMPLGFSLQFHTLTAKKPEIIYDDKRMTVTCFPLKHRIPTWGFLFKENPKPTNTRGDKPRSFACCSDTMYMEQLPHIISDVDLLYHEATYSNNEKERAQETFHSTAEDAARIALAANVGKLVIGHFSSRYKDIEPLLKQAKNIFPNTEAAEDGSRFEV